MPGVFLVNLPVCFFCYKSIYLLFKEYIKVSAEKPVDINFINASYYNSSGSSFDRIPCSAILTKLLKKYDLKGNVLEIGSGPGNLAVWMEESGCSVTCIEPAEEFAKKSIARGLKVYNVTLQQFEMDGVYDHMIAISSLIHILKKDLPLQIKKIALGLKPGGTFFVTFIEGDSEALEDPTKMGKLRFFARFKEEEIETLLSPYFELLERHKIYQEKMDRNFFLMVYSKKTEGDLQLPLQ